MKKIELIGTDFIKNINLISNILKGKVTLNGGCSYLIFSNNLGKGTITSIKVSKDISVIIFDVNFNEDLEFIYSSSEKEYIDFFFCLEGSVFHKVNKENSFEKIRYRQNALVSRLKSSKNVITFERNVPSKVSVISYSIVNGDSDKQVSHDSLRKMATKALQQINKAKDYRYLGRVCFRTSDYVKKMMSFSFDEASNILFVEAAILNTIASQIERYEKDNDSSFSDAPIKQYELDKIIAVEAFVHNNLAEKLSLENLARMSGLSLSKLQLGFNYLYNTTVNNYITQKRLDKSVEYLQQNKLNISEIVYSVGYSSRSYFSKIFKKRFGISPSTALQNSANQLRN